MAATRVKFDGHDWANVRPTDQDDNPRVPGNNREIERPGDIAAQSERDPRELLCRTDQSDTIDDHFGRLAGIFVPSQQRRASETSSAVPISKGGL